MLTSEPASLKNLPGPANRPIIMGDLVGSSGLPEAAEAQAGFADALAWANRQYRNTLAFPLSPTSGDAFQTLAASLEAGWVIVRGLARKLAHKGLDCRFVLALGEVRETPGARNTLTFWGQGFKEARRVMDDKRETSRYRFVFPRTDVSLLLNGLGRALTEIEDGWTARQAEIVALARTGKGTKAALAEELGISRASLYDVLGAARYRLYDDLLSRVAEVCRLWDREEE